MKLKPEIIALLKTGSFCVAGSMTKSGVKEVWQVFEWKHIISTSNFWLKGDLPHEQEYLKGFSFARFGIFLDRMGSEREGGDQLWGIEASPDEEVRYIEAFMD